MTTDQIDMPIEVLEENTCPAVIEQVFENLIISESGHVVPRDIIQFYALPFFSTKRVEKQPAIWKNADGTSTLEICPSTQGRPTCYDKDLITWAISHLRERIDGKIPGQKISPDTDSAPTITVDAYQVLREIHRPVEQIRTNDATWRMWCNTGDKLTNSTVKSTIEFGGKMVYQEHFLTKFGLQVNKDGSSFEFTFKIADWIWNAVRKEHTATQNMEIIRLDPFYYKIPLGLERRLYEVIRKGAGLGKNAKSQYSIALSKLKYLCGSSSTDNDFRKAIVKVIERDRGDNSEPGRRKTGKRTKTSTKKFIGQFYHWTIYLNDKEGNIFRADNMKRIKDVMKKEHNNADSEKAFRQLSDPVDR